MVRRTEMGSVARAFLDAFFVRLQSLGGGGLRDVGLVIRATKILFDVPLLHEIAA